MPQLALHTSFGDLTISEDEGHIVALDWGWPAFTEATPLLENAVNQLREYYGNISATLKSHARAVGLACGRNPIPIIIPCHRVLTSTGRLGGYSGDGGIKTKKQLLNLENISAFELS